MYKNTDGSSTRDSHFLARMLKIKVIWLYLSGRVTPYDFYAILSLLYVFQDCLSWQDKVLKLLVNCGMPWHNEMSIPGDCTIHPSIKIHSSLSLSISHYGLPQWDNKGNGFSRISMSKPIHLFLNQVIETK